MKSGTYIMAVIVASFVLIGYLFATAPESAPAQLPLILAAVGALVAVLNKQGDTDAKVESSIAVSKENTHSIAAVSAQTGHALDTVAQKQDTTNKLVDGHLSGLNAQIAALSQTVARLETDKAVKLVETAQILAAVVAVSPAPSTGTTPLGTPVDGGTTIEPGGPTVIKIDPDHPVAIEAEQKPPKGKRVRVGDQQ